MIRTPDQKLRVFVSSTLAELAPERAAAKDAIEQLRLTPILFELGARPHPPRALYRAYLEQSDVFVAIWWQRYGWVAPDMDISGLEDEYRLSEGMPRLFYLKRPAPEIEDGLQWMIADLQDGDTTSYRPFETADELRELLAEDLALLLAERFDAAAARPRAPSNAPTSAAPRPRTPLIGRERDVDRLVAAVTDPDTRLVTLTGTGGIGKTRLALATLDAAGSRFEDGGAFVDLSPVGDPAGVALAIAASLGLQAEGRERNEDALVRGLRDRSMLLVLDNFEQVVDAASLVARLTETCPGVRLLITSRVLLRLRGEQQYPVEPLGLSPGDGQLAPGVALFEARARDVQPGFAVTDENAAAVAELCERLDGLPLALELAAAQVRLLTPEQLLERLGRTLDLAGYRDLPDRQRTLAATLDWSYELLPAEAQQLLGWLSVFTGSFTLDGAEAVCADADLDVPTGLATLLDHSLVVRADRPEGEPGFRMLDTVRAYGRRRLEEAGETGTAYEGLYQHVSERFASAAAHMYGERQMEMVHRLDPELPNAMDVLSWCFRAGRSPGPLIQAMISAWVFMGIRGVGREFPDLEETVLESPLGAGLTDQERLAIYVNEAGRRWSGGLRDSMLDVAQRGLALAREMEAHDVIGLLLHMIAAARPYEEADAIRAELAEAMEHHDKAGDPAMPGYTSVHLGDLRLNDGDVDGARQAFEEVRAVGESMGNRMMLGWAWLRLALVELAANVPAAARANLEHAMDHRDALSLEDRSYCLFALAELAATIGRPAEAARLIGAVDQARESIGLLALPLVARLEEQHRDRIRTAVGAERFETEHREGGSIGLDEAIDLGLQVTSSQAGEAVASIS